MKYMKITALLLVGSFFLCGCSGGKVRSGVHVNGIDVGGLSYQEAAERVRENLQYEPLTIVAPSGNYTAPLDYADDLDLQLKKAKRGVSLSVMVRREWVNMEKELLSLCAENAEKGVDAELRFSAEGFTYIPEINGISCDYKQLLCDAQEALRTGKTEISLVCREAIPAVTAEMLKARTQPLAAFSTRFDASNAPRSRNIALAAERISGTVIEPNATFSFNERVGKRTEENGFQIAAVIQEGEFVQGVGGGVCQASTTLFGAALRAGLDIVESHPHSLAVSYVVPSQDAMVSEYSDLKFRNPYEFPVYLLAECGHGVVKFALYGMPDGFRYEVESKVLFRLAPPPAKIVEGAENRVIRAEKAGLASESYLLVYDELGNLRSRTLIRRDTYACVQGIRECVPEPQTPEEVLDGEMGEIDGETKKF